MGAGLVDAGRIDKNDLRGGMNPFARRNLDHSRDSVAGGLRLGADNGDFFTGKGVEQRAFAGVGPAQNGDKSRFQRFSLTPDFYYRGFPDCALWLSMISGHI